MRYLFLICVISIATMQTLQGQAVCGFDESNQMLLNKFPQLKQKVAVNNLQLREAIQRRNKFSPSSRVANIFQIPVVVHILHTGDSIGSIYNPTKQQVLAALDYLNEVYSGTHPSLTNEGANAAGDIGLRFVLAKRDPGCNPTDGINRVNMSGNQQYISAGAKNADVDYDLNLKSPIAWDPSRYYNIYVVNKINGKDGTSGQFVAGFAYFPTSSIVDGIVMLATQMKANSKTLAHEIGHAFNLYHPFEGSSRNDVCPTGDNDEVDDTDPISYNANSAGLVNFTCRTGSNKCNNNKPYTIRTEANFMNYTTCYTLFTPGQRDRMQASMLLDERKSLATSTALLETYAGDGNACVPNINFEEDTASLTGPPAASTGCRRYTDHTFYLTVGNAPSAQATAILSTDPESDAKEGVDFDFVSGKNITFPAGNRNRRAFKVRVYDVGQRQNAKKIKLDFTVNNGGGNARKGTSRTAMRLGLKPIDNRPVLTGTTKQFDIGRTDRKLTDALMFDGYVKKQRTQILYRAAELKALGISAGDIKGVSFMIGKKTNTAFKNLRVKMGQTPAAQLIENLNISPVQNMQEVLYRSEYSTVSGWNNFAFTTAFAWNGTDNLCVELCFDNGELTSNRTDTLSMYSDGSASNIANMMGAEEADCNGAFSSVSYYPAGVKPIIRLSYDQPGNPVASGTGSTATEYLGPNAEVFFYDNESPKRIIASIKNLGSWNYGCVDFTIDRSGSNTTPFWNNEGKNGLTNKTFFASPQYNNSDGAYEITLYYTANQKRVYELATRNEWTDIQVIKTKVPVNDITPGNPQVDKVEINPVVQHLAFGEDVALRARFNTGFSGYAVGVVNNIALPVTWLDMQARYENDQVVVGWKTATETNNQFFSVELSLDGIHFEPVHKTEGRGNSNVISSYSYNHQYPPQGLLYYRVRQVDFDGNYSYSNIVQVMVAGSASKLSVFPVPANSFVMVNFGKAIFNAYVQVISNDGKIVHNEKLAGLHSQRKISVAGLTSGTYIIRLIDGNNVQVLRFIKN